MPRVTPVLSRWPLPAVLLLAAIFPGKGFADVKTFGSEGVRFVLQGIDHPFYEWPRTLLSYPVRFEGARVKPEGLSLLRTDTGEGVPFQLSRVNEEGGALRFAMVSFLSDLPAGERRVFELRPGTPATPEAAMHESREGNAIVIDTGAVKVRIPATQRPGAQVPGPILAMSRGGAWLGDSRLLSPKRRVLRLTTTREEAGPLFVTYRVSYELEGNARYTARLRFVAGLDFVRLFEEMEGIPREEGAAFVTSWAGFHPTHRQAPNHPYQQANKEPGYARYNWERIDEALVSTQHGVSAGIGAGGELPFRLGPYQPWGAYVILTFANFWDERANDAVGLFIDRVGEWQDHDYAIWAGSSTLQVRYFYQDGLLSWRYPLSTGTRSTAIACYDHAKDIQAMEALDALASKGVPGPDGRVIKARLSPTSRVHYLQNRYGTLDLDMVKDWVLQYPDGAKRQPVLFQEGTLASPADLERAVYGSELVRDLPPQGTRQNAGFAPVPSRSIYGWFIDGYNRLLPQMTDEQRRRLDGIYLMMAYTHAGEDYMPMQCMLAGHPNFLSDVKSVPALMASLYPEHPMAREWADEFEKFVELNTHYHTRPAVPAWEAKGGRWTENLGTYVWAFLRPAMRGEFGLRQWVDGRNRLATPQMAQIGEWLVDSLTAPFEGEDLSGDNLKYWTDANGKLPMHAWGMVTRENGPRRVHPPQGAHSARRMPPRAMWTLGRSLLRYRPLVAEHMMWASRPGDQDSEHAKEGPDAWRLMAAGPDNRGTNPHLRSSKYTGYGIMLRAGVDTPGEVSVHLQQVDEGPNYRWGIVAEGGCGNIYYYAAGKAYSHNGREDVGDRACHDTDFGCNFGVWKDGRFRAVGRNVLERPLYDLDVAQFAELLPRQGASAYSWPEYQARRVTLVGSDYLVVHDDVFNDAITHRFSWFVHAADTMPFIHMVRGDTQKTSLETDTTKGAWYDGQGDCLAVVTHKPGLTVERLPAGCRVTGDGSTDTLLTGDTADARPQGRPAGRAAAAPEAGIRFQGTSAVVRRRADGETELALFHGSSLAAGGLTLSVDDTDLGVSARFREPSEARGVCFGRNGGTLRLQAERPLAAGVALYVDGARIAAAREGDALVVTLPAGRHAWQLTAGLPVPPAPTVLRTENRSGGARVFWSPAAGAASYRVELSRDGGTTWAPAGTTAGTDLALAGLENGTKVHVRVVALNDQHESAPADEYPIYVTDQPPLPPDGLKLQLGKGNVRLTWGEVLGVGEYRVYRRARGGGEWQRVFAGLANEHTDAAPGAVPAFSQPGAAANLLREGPAPTLYEYAVASVSGNGEGPRCTPIDTDPASWRNWDPKPGEPFRRLLTYNLTAFEGDSTTPPYYP